jgi:hypothetical protein
MNIISQSQLSDTQIMTSGCTQIKSDSAKIWWHYYDASDWMTITICQMATDKKLMWQFNAGNI